MNVYLTAPVLFLTFLVQTSFLGTLAPTGLRPDLVLLLVIAIGTISGPGRAMAWSVPAGLLLDAAGTAPLGANLVAVLAVALLTALRDTDLVEGKLTLTLALTFIGTFVYACTFLIIMQLTGRRVEWLASLIWIAVPVAVLNIVVMPAVYWLARKLALPQLVKSATFARL